MRREKSLRIGVHHANAVVWEPVYRTHLTSGTSRCGIARSRFAPSAMDANRDTPAALTFCIAAP